MERFVALDEFEGLCLAQMAGWQGLLGRVGVVLLGHGACMVGRRAGQVKARPGGVRRIDKWCKPLEV